MPKLQIINEHQLDDWVSKNDREAQTLIVELINKLVSVSCPNSTYQSFPLHVNQPGPDGEVITEFGYKSFIPDGRSFWEIKTSRKAGTEATEAYNYYTKTIPEDVRMASSFVFVTPRSSASDWQNTWKEEGIANWIKTREDLNEWNAIKVINGAILADWLSFFPALGQWFACRILGLRSGFETGYSRWELLRSYGEPPHLCHDLFTAGRQEASHKLSGMLIQQESSRLRIDTRYPDHVADFVSAYLQTLDEKAQPKFLPRVLIFSSEDGWREACNLQERHIFVADFDIDSKRGSQLLQLATSSGHAVVYPGYPGGVPHGNVCDLYQPTVQDMKQALVKSGYTDERARILTNRSGRDLNGLLRLIQGMSTHPDWATKSEAADFAIALLIGQWKDEGEGDQSAIGDLSGKAYGEWIAKIRKVASAKAAPLEYAIGRWKFTSRYEPWLYLGGQIGPDVLERFKTLAIRVLTEPDPRLELPKQQRFAASAYGKERKYSNRLREGIAETLALLGSHGDALTSCRSGLPKSIAASVVNELLSGATSHEWASLNDVLPLLAEASPDEFLKAVGGASEKPDEPFSGVFSEEGDVFYGGSFITGLLWALESLAWNEDYLIRVCGILANLAAVDPGGNWSNRPSNSLRGILLPWFPQTAATPERRHAAVRSIIRDQPMIGWNLILQLLPENHSMGHPTHRPKWQNFVPDNWSDGVTNGQRWEDEGFYADLALEIAGNDPAKLADLLPFYFYIHPRFSKFSENYRNRLLSESVLSLSEEQRLSLWMEISGKTSNHRKYADSDAWKVAEDMLQLLEEVAEQIKPQEPSVRHQRLFSGRDFDLYDEIGNWEEQRQRLLDKRIEALKEIYNKGSNDALRNFWRSVEAPNEVGNACGSDDSLANDGVFLPDLLESETDADFRFAVAYVWRRYHNKSWDWIENLDRSNWSVKSKADFFAVLPSIKQVWERAEIELGSDQDEYWTRARIHPQSGQLDGFEHVIRKLISVGRVDMAIQCFWLGDLWTENYPNLALEALEAFNPEKDRVDAHTITEVFSHLQKEINIDEERLAAMEVKFLSLLDRFGGTRPHTLYRRLTERPEFFCEVIRMIYRSRDEVSNEEETEEDEQPTEVDESKASIVRNAYQLLRDWDYPPGSQRNGGFDNDALKKWTDAVIASCATSGHKEVASHQIGEVFYYAPLAEDGLWIDPVCELLDSKDNPEFRRGLRIRIFNSRGVHGFSGGKDEIELAEKWEKIATKAENKGFLRLGTTLRGLGESYREDAKRSIDEDRYRFD